MKIFQVFKNIFKKSDIDIQALHHEVNNTLLEKELKRIHLAIDTELELIEKAIIQANKLNERVGVKI